MQTWYEHSYRTSSTTSRAIWREQPARRRRSSYEYSTSMLVHLLLPYVSQKLTIIPSEGAGECVMISSLWSIRSALRPAFCECTVTHRGIQPNKAMAARLWSQSYPAGTQWLVKSTLAYETYIRPRACLWRLKHGRQSPCHRQLTAAAAGATEEESSEAQQSSELSPAGETQSAAIQEEKATEIGR
eukprot:scaffold355670_cov36-Prasinocladus_malaysianus.AAC.2